MPGMQVILRQGSRMAYCGWYAGDERAAPKLNSRVLVFEITEERVLPHVRGFEKPL